MSKEKRTAVDLAVSVAIGSLVYLSGQLLLALLVVKGWLPEERIANAQMILGAVGAFLGGSWAVAKLSLGALSASALTAAGMAAAIVLLGVMCYEEMAPAGEVALRLLLMTAGAFTAGILGAGRNDRRRKRRSSGARRKK